ncbi:Importin subunit alpha [Entamoeba marina]
MGSDPLPYKIIERTGVLHKVVSILNSNDLNNVLHALHICINFTSESDEYTKHLIDCGFLNHVPKLVISSDVKIAQNTFWLLANISGDGGVYKGIIINLDIIGLMNESMKIHNDETIMENFFWILTNLCHGKPFLDLSYVNTFIPYVTQCLTSSKNLEQLSDALWCYTFLSEYQEYDSFTTNQQIIQTILNYCTSDNPKISTPSLHYFAYFTMRPDDFVRSLLSFGLLNVLHTVIASNPVEVVMRNAYWCVSNITACTSVDIIKQVKNFEFLKQSINTAESFGISDGIREEMFWVVVNYCFGANMEMISELLGEIPAFINVLVAACCNSKSEERLIQTSLKSIQKTLKFCDELHIDILQTLDELQFDRICEDIILTSDNKISKARAQFIMDNYLAVGDFDKMQ